jgi:hypothetical protein
VAAVDVPAARRLAGIGVGFERCDDRIDIAGSQRVLILGDDT